MAVPISKCNFCYGYGFWADDDYPIEEADAILGVDSDDCWNCQSNNAFYEALADGFDGLENNMDLLALTPQCDSLSTLKDFDKLCAE